MPNQPKPKKAAPKTAAKPKTAMKPKAKKEFSYSLKDIAGSPKESTFDRVTKAPVRAALYPIGKAMELGTKAGAYVQSKMAKTSAKPKPKPQTKKK
jgi:hypothetical protein